MQKRELEKGDVLQITPTSKNEWGGFLIVVSEPKSFGCQGYLMSHNNFEACRVIKTGKAYARVKFEDMEYVGKIPWIISDRDEAQKSTETEI